MKNGSNRYGLISMICGIVSVVTFCSWLICIPLAVISIIFGVLQMKKGEANGMAVAGIVCAVIALLLQLFLIVFSISYMNNPYQYDRMIEEMVDDFMR